MGVICESLPVALLKRGAELSPWSHLIGVRELRALHPLVNLVQSLLPFHGRHQLLHQLPAHVALVHVALPIHVGVHIDLRAADLRRTSNSYAISFPSKTPSGFKLYEKQVSEDIGVDIWVKHFHHYCVLTRHCINICVWPTSTCLRTSLRGSVADCISSEWKAPLTARGLALMK